MAAPNMTLVTQADLSALFSSNYNADTGRTAISVQGSVSAELGNLGIREMTGLVINASGGRIRVTRIGQTVTWWLTDVVTSRGGNFNLIDPNATGINPLTPVVNTEVAIEGEARVGITTLGNVFLRNAVNGATYNGSITFATPRGWWAGTDTLPGAPHGQGVM